MEQILQVGIISSTHGVRGEVKVFPTTDDVKRFSSLKNVYLEDKEKLIPLTIEGVKYFKQFAILKFKEFQSLDEILPHKGKGLYVDRKDAQALGEDEYYIADLIGMTVKTEDGKDFGVVKEIMETGANDVYIVDAGQCGEVLIPAIKECILDVNIAEGILTVHLMKGLLP